MTNEEKAQRMAGVILEAPSQLTKAQASKYLNEVWSSMQLARFMLDFPTESAITPGKSERA